MLNPFAGYREFVNSYTGQKNCDYGSLKTLNINGIKVALLGLNSALMAGRHKKDNDEYDEYDDERFLIVGYPQIVEPLKRISNIQDYRLRIAVMHHPFDWLCQWDKVKIEQRLGKTFHFVLRGHEHRANAISVVSRKSDCRLISAGYGFDRINYPNGYNFVHLDFESQQVTVYCRKWFEREEQWVADNEINADDKDIDADGKYGKYNFPFPQNLQDKISPSRQSTSLKPNVTKHCKGLSKKILDSEVVPFLGADINLCNRPFKEISDPWKWNINSKYPPTNVELAAYIDRQLAGPKKSKHEYLEEVRCPLCDPQTFPGDPKDPCYPSGFPPECPINTGIVTRLHLQHVSQFWSKEGIYQLRDHLIPIYEYEKYQPNCVHEFLANLPSIIKNYLPYKKFQKDSTKTSLFEPLPTNYPLIVTVCFDSTLEIAFKQKRQPYDLVSYVGNKFIHQTFDPEDDNDNNDLINIGEITKDNNDTVEWFKFRPVILRLCGPANGNEDENDEKITITEDHFLKYFSSDINRLLPLSIWQKLTQSNLWFLGYSLSYWNLRGLVRQIGYPPDSPTIETNWYSVQEKPDTLDQRLWSQRELRSNRKQVQFYGDQDIPSLEKYIEEVNRQVEEQSKKGSASGQICSQDRSTQEVFISYNWQEDSNEMANKLVQAFKAEGITIIRDKTHTTFKDSIKNFMQRIGQGKCVVVVISDRYLKSEYCMFELVEIAENGDFYGRIFPIVLPDAKIYDDFERIDYLKYWEQKKAKLQEKYKTIDLPRTDTILKTLNLYDEIRGNIDNLTNLLKDMNTLSPDLLLESKFEQMIKAVKTKLSQ